MLAAINSLASLLAKFRVQFHCSLSGWQHFWLGIVHALLEAILQFLLRIKAQKATGPGLALKSLTITMK